MKTSSKKGFSWTLSITNKEIEKAEAGEKKRNEKIRREMKKYRKNWKLGKTQAV